MKKNALAELRLLLHRMWKESRCARRRSLLRRSQRELAKLELAMERHGMV